MPPQPQILAAALGMALAACDPWTLPPTSPGPFNFIGREELAAQGFKLEVISPEETLACDKGGSCVCLRELDCCDSCTSEAGEDGKKQCISLEKNLEVFRKELESKGDSQVLCELGETGTCGPFTYFEFMGGIHQYELRYFGPDGRLVGQRNYTDYRAYCGRRTNRVFMGRIPACRERNAFRKLCGTISSKNSYRGTVLDDLMR
jgi:hypothetical protein